MEMNDGELLIYSECSNQFRINNRTRCRLEQMLNRVKDYTGVPVAGYTSSFPEKHYTSAKIFAAFKTLDEKVRDSLQIKAGFVVLEKTPKTMHFYDQLTSIMASNPMLITDIFDQDAKLLEHSFVKNMHDQSFFSVALKTFKGLALQEAPLKSPDKIVISREAEHSQRFE